MTLDFYQDQGTRSQQQDRYVILSTMDGLAAHVLDGHGNTSDAVITAAICLEQDSLPRFHAEQENAEICRGLNNICQKYDKQGCTLSSVYIFGNKTYFSILGDSPALYCKNGKIIRMPLHDISNSDELELRLKAGAELDKNYPKHIFIPGTRQGLSTFRAIGDSIFGDILGREPDFYEIPTEDWKWIIVASDGLKLNDKEIIKSVNKGAKELIKTNSAILAGDPIDNTTMILIRK